MENRKYLLNKILSNEKTIVIVEKYLQNKTAERWQAWLKQLNLEKFYMPVFGVQGSGKSTILNALLFGERILPTDAPETTCVPTEIHYQPDKMGKAVVCYKNGTSEEVTASESVLALYLDNEHNPGNCLQVERVEVYSDNELLKNGLVLVDLPGYGSLTLENQKTTLDYLTNSSGVIFLIRSAPPLTRGETYWIRIVWPLLPQALFCQSCWDTDSNVEIEDAKDHNLSVLSNEKRIIWSDLFENPNLICVNGEGALGASFSNNVDDFEESGMPLLRKEIQSYADSWPYLTETGIYKHVKIDTSNTLIYLENRITLLDKDSFILDEIIKQEEELFKEYKEGVVIKTTGAREKTGKFKKELDESILINLRDSEMILRNNMRTKLRAGIVDGERLNIAFKAECDDIEEQIYIEVQDRLMLLQSELIAQLENIQEWDFNKRTATFDYKTAEKVKYENIFPVIGNIGGGIAGALGGTAVGTAIGAKLGAALGISLGPAGVIVGTILGAIVGGLLIGKLGRGAKTLVLDKRIAQAEPQVFCAVTSFIDNLRATLQSNLKDFDTYMNKQLDEWINAQQEAYDNELRKKVELKTMEKSDKVREKVNLQADLNSIRSFIDTLEEA